MWIKIWTLFLVKVQKVAAAISISLLLYSLVLLRIFFKIKFVYIIQFQLVLFT